MARYTRCWDQTRRAVEKVNGYITLAGPELVLYQPEYTHSFIDPANHDDHRSAGCGRVRPCKPKHALLPEARPILA